MILFQVRLQFCQKNNINNQAENSLTWHYFDKVTMGYFGDVDISRSLFEILGVWICNVVNWSLLE